MDMFSPEYFLAFGLFATHLVFVLIQLRICFNTIVHTSLAVIPRSSRLIRQVHCILRLLYRPTPFVVHTPFLAKL